MIMCRAVSPFSSVAFMSILFAKNIFYFLVIPSFYLLIDNVVF